MCRVLGAGNSNLPRILQVIVQVLSKGHDLATEDTVRSLSLSPHALKP